MMSGQQPRQMERKSLRMMMAPFINGTVL
uniref:Uncharacterized protein n=1 Tax=Arundo donax TaxID=35708 RepID=A0A0A9FFC8_ARUDO